MNFLTQESIPSINHLSELAEPFLIEFFQLTSPEISHWMKNFISHPLQLQAESVLQGSACLGCSLGGASAGRGCCALIVAAGQHRGGHKILL